MPTNRPVAMLHDMVLFAAAAGSVMKSKGASCFRSVVVVLSSFTYVVSWKRPRDGRIQRRGMFATCAMRYILDPCSLLCVELELAMQARTHRPIIYDGSRRSAALLHA